MKERTDLWRNKTDESPFAIAKKIVEDSVRFLPENWMVQGGPLSQLHYALMAREYNRMLDEGTLVTSNSYPLRKIKPKVSVDLALAFVTQAGFQLKQAIYVGSQSA